MSRSRGYHDMRPAEIGPLRASQPVALSRIGCGICRPAENGRPFPDRPWKTGGPVSHSYRSRDDDKLDLKN